MKKAALLATLQAEFTEARHFAAWHADAGEGVYHVRITALCDRLRLMFFGNLHQDWSEFVLSDESQSRAQRDVTAANSTMMTTPLT